MDQFSIAAGTVGILVCVARLSSAMSRFKDDYKLADADLDINRQHALLLKQEIRALESKKGSHHPPPHKSAEGQDGFDRGAKSSHLVLENDVYESLDGDGWTLLHCCIHFGAPRFMRLVLQNNVDVNQLSHPAPLSEDPELSYRELTLSDITIYIGPNRYQMFVETLTETGRDEDTKGNKDIFWDATPDTLREDSEAAGKPRLSTAPKMLMMMGGRFYMGIVQWLVQSEKTPPLGRCGPGTPECQFAGGKSGVVNAKSF